MVLGHNLSAKMDCLQSACLKMPHEKLKERGQSDMTIEQTEAAAYDMIYLISCAAAEVIPNRKRIADMNLENVYTMCEFHNLTAMAYMVFENIHISDMIKPDLFYQWKESKEKAIRKNLLLDTERQSLLSYLEKERIWYLPLKGILLKELYPKQGMRQMVDNDILYDKDYQDKIASYFMKNGYKVLQVGKGNHDVFQKNPVYNYEMHTSLFNSQNPVLLKYYADVKEYLIKDVNNSYGYHFSDEDFYIYMIAHEYKHYCRGGTGLRSLLDRYVYEKEKGSTLDWNYIERELNEQGSARFEKSTRCLSKKIFSAPIEFRKEELLAEEHKLLSYYLFSGCFGTYNNLITNNLKILQRDGENILAKAKGRYILKRMFPDLKFMKENYPFLDKHGILLPVGYVHRLFLKGICNRKELWKEFQALWRN